MGYYVLLLGLCLELYFVCGHGGEDNKEVLKADKVKGYEVTTTSRIAK
jgi:hypothetical protein